MRRYPSPFYGNQLIGNVNSKEVHDLDNEDVNENGCQIDEIKDIALFVPDTLVQAKSEGYDSCDKCLEGSTD